MADCLELLIHRELRSPNAWLWKHWRVKQRERHQWEMEIGAALLIPEARKNIFAILLATNAVPSAQRVCTERRRVTVTRIVPRRKFIRDDDNLRFSVKPVNDALKKLGLIKDDNRKWLEQAMPIQEASTDGKCYTRITIERLP